MKLLYLSKILYVMVLLFMMLDFSQSSSSTRKSISKIKSILHEVEKIINMPRKEKKLPKQTQVYHKKEIYHTNPCDEAKQELYFQDYYQSTDQFYPASVTTLSCKNALGPRGYPVSKDGKCDCITQRRRIYFQRRPNTDCRRWNLESIVIPDGCKCFKAS